MILNQDKFKKLMATDFDNNIHKCARALELDVSTVCRFVNGKQGSGLKLITNFMKYCVKMNLDCNDYIFLPKPLIIDNGYLPTNESKGA